MVQYKIRDNYFQLIANRNKLIAHNRDLNDGNGLRNCYAKINDELELQSACESKAHFPFILNIGQDIKWLDGGSALPTPKIGNHLYFLTKLDKDAYPTEDVAIHEAYELTMMAMNEFISYLIEDNEENGICGNMLVIDFNSFSATQVGPINNTLFGWYFKFQDKKTGNELKFDNTKWFQTP